MSAAECAVWLWFCGCVCPQTPQTLTNLTVPRQPALEAAHAPPELPPSGPPRCTDPLQSQPPLPPPPLAAPSAIAAAAALPRLRFPSPPHSQSQSQGQLKEDVRGAGHHQQAAREGGGGAQASGLVAGGTFAGGRVGGGLG